MVLHFYIPRHSDKITITEYSSDEIVSQKDMSAQEYKEHPITIKNNKFNYTIISSVRDEKVTDTVKFYVSD